MRRQHPWLLLSVLAVAGTLLTTTAAPRVLARTPAEQAKGKTRDIFLSVTDKAGAPATGLTINDFTVREDNQSREVLAAAAATMPMRIVLLIDNSQATQSLANEMRIAMAGFINAIFKASPDSTMALMTFGDRPTPVQEFTSAAPILARAAQRIFPITGAGAYMTDAVADAAKMLRRDPATRQVIVAFIDESGEEFSNTGRQEALDALRQSNAALWIVALQSAATSMTSSEARDRSALIDEGASGTGGTTLPLLNRLSLPPKMLELAGLLTHQIQVTYGRPDQMIPPKKLDVQLTRKDLKMQAPRWAGQ